MRERKIVRGSTRGENFPTESCRPACGGTRKGYNIQRKKSSLFQPKRSFLSCGEEEDIHYYHQEKKHGGQKRRKNVFILP